MLFSECRRRLRYYFPRPRQPHKAQCRLSLEYLEERTVLSVIQWTNRGNDGFDAVFGANANLARDAAAAALLAWQNVITDFNYADGTNTFRISMSMANQNGIGGFASRGTIDAAGKLHSGNIGILDGINGLGSGWYLDPDPTDETSFRGNVINAFSGTSTAGNASRSLFDLYDVVASEVAHLMGLASFPGSSFAKNTRGYLKATGKSDLAHAGKLFTFTGPSTTALYTSDDGGSDRGTPTHIAEPPNQFTDPATGIKYFGAIDANNAFFTNGTRSVPSLLDALVLHDVYDYTIALPQTFGTFYANLDSTTGNFLVRGGTAGGNSDNLTVSRQGDTLLASVDVGNPVPGTGPAGALVTVVPAGAVNTVTIRAGSADAVYDLQDPLAGITTTVTGGSRSNTLIGPDQDTTWTITGANKGNMNGNIAFSGIQKLVGGAGADTFVIQTGASLTGSIDGGAGSNTLDYSAVTADVIVNLQTPKATRVGGTFANIQNFVGGGGNNTLVGADVPNVWNITATDTGSVTGADTVAFRAFQNLSGGAAANTFVFSDGAGISGNLNGGGGLLDYSAYSTSVIVNLQTGTATGVGGSIANIQNVTGGNGGGAGVYNILVGNGGNILTGGTGRRNLLIAGSSASTLVGGDDDDILIGGTTAYDMDAAALLAIMNYWSGSSDDYATRVGNLLAGNGVPLLDATTVTSNGGGNTLTGGPGLNLYYGNGADITDFDPSSGAVFVSV
jgi:hypothetical protein